MIRSITLVLALSFGMAPALGRSTQAADAPRLGEFRQQVRPGFVVDGLPVMSIELQIWTGIQWVPVGSDDAVRALSRKRPVKGRRE